MGIGPIHRGVAAATIALGLLAGCSSDDTDGASATTETDTAAESRPARLAKFTEVAGEVGLTHVQHELSAPPGCLFNAADPGDNGCVEERMTGGVAVGDYDADGLPDLYFTRLDGPGVLYRNEAGTFVDVTEATGLAALTVPSNGAAWADLENDGFPDLYVTTMAAPRSQLFMNRGDGAFTEEAEARGAAVADGFPRGGMSVAVGDYDRDGWLDLHTTAWELPREGDEPPAPHHTRLLRNLGAANPGHFEDTTEAAGVTLDRESVVAGIPGYTPSFSFGSALVDLDGDGWQDLAVTSDFQTSQLFWNDGDGTFTDGTEAAAIGTEGNAMGSTFGDYDGDGDLDWFVTAIMDPANECAPDPCDELHTGNRLYRNEGDRTFTDVTDEAGVRDGLWGWGAAMFDFDNDGNLDIVMTNGQKFQGAGYGDLDSPTGDYFAESAPRLWHNTGGGAFDDLAEAAGFEPAGLGKGVAVLDYDADGDLDVVVANNGGTPALYRNDDGVDASWLRVDVQGTSSNHDGVGAIVVVETSDGERQTREVGAASHFLGQSERILHFGLATHRTVESVHVEWPASGKETTIEDPEPNQVLVVTEPE